MKLHDYLTAHKITNSAFGEAIGVCGWSVGRYLKGFPPKRAVANKIVASTYGAVTIGDLYPDMPWACPPSPQQNVSGAQ